MRLARTVNLVVLLGVITFASGATIIDKHKAQYGNKYYKPQGGWEKISCLFTVGPFDCQTAKDDAVVASQAAQTRYPGYKLHNDAADAFRHCYWSALMTQHIGVTQAKIVGDNHEQLNDGPADEKHMDLYNNAVGLQVGLLSTGPDTAEEMCFIYAITKRLLISP